MASDRSPEALAPLKEAAGRAAAELVEDGMKVGLGTGTTVAYLLAALGERAGELRDMSCAATSPQTMRIALELGLNVRELDELGELDIAIDGADQVDRGGWLIKGGGGAHTREKIVAAAARRFVVIVSANKLCARLQPPVPLEVLGFGAAHTLAALGDARLRAPGSDEVPSVSPDGNLLAWYEGPIEDPRALAARLSETPGVVEHGLFAPELVSEIVIASPDGVRRRTAKQAG
jgi:ribose 5-phosphate isomerase A